MRDAEYLIRREQQELAAALQAADARVRQIHLDLASAYTSRLSDTERAGSAKVEAA